MMLRRAVLLATVVICALFGVGVAQAQAPNPAPLLKAAAAGNAPAVDRLLAQGIGVDAAGADGRTALMLAAAAGKLNVVSTLVRAGADVNASSAKGETPLMAAAGSGNTELVRFLLYMGASRASTSLQGHTAADVARRAKYPHLATLLEPDGERTAPAKPSRPARTDASRQARPDASRQARPDAAGVDARWQTIEQTLRPDLLIKQSAEFARDYPDSKYGKLNKALESGANRAFQALREAQLSMEAIDEIGGDGNCREALAKALRGDHDAALRLATMYRQGSNGLAQDERRSEQWLQIAAELGNGKASWQLAQIYNRNGQVGAAARFETKAIEAGYRPPVRLPTRSINY